MRGGPLLRLVPVALVVGAATAMAAPSGPTEFDGQWFVRAVSEPGTCNNAILALPIAVQNGEVRDVGIFGASAKGSVDAGGSLTVSISHDKDVVEARGALKGDRGEGEWTSPTLACSGQWVAQRI